MAKNPAPVHADSTDKQKHAWCMERTGFCAAFLTPRTYAAVERDGMDMRYYVIQKPISRTTEVARGGTIIHDDDDDDNDDYALQQDCAMEFARTIGCTVIHDEIICNTKDQWDALLAFRLLEGLT